MRSKCGGTFLSTFYMSRSKSGFLKNNSLVRIPQSNAKSKQGGGRPCVMSSVPGGRLGDWCFEPSPASLAQKEPLYRVGAPEDRAVSYVSLSP